MVTHRRQASDNLARDIKAEEAAEQLAERERDERVDDDTRSRADRLDELEVDRQQARAEARSRRSAVTGTGH